MVGVTVNLKDAIVLGIGVAIGTFLGNLAINVLMRKAD
jgi:hypothetical protein